MVRRIGVWMCVLAFALIWAAPASAAGGPPGWSKGRKKGWKGNSTPPGWSKGKKKGWKGKKKGWKGKDVPPGWAKKNKSWKDDESGKGDNEKKETAQEQSERILREVSERILKEIGQGKK